MRTALTPVANPAFLAGRSLTAPVVFDNLIHRREMPVTVGVFVDPGRPENRNLEYDTFSDAYATFLLTEILPIVQARYRITDDPDHWAIGGASSGGAARSANLRVAAALAERGYDLRLVLGDGGRDPNHGGALLPHAVRWVWRCEST